MNEPGWEKCGTGMARYVTSHGSFGTSEKKEIEVFGDVKDQDLVNKFGASWGGRVEWITTQPTEQRRAYVYAYSE